MKKVIFFKKRKHNYLKSIQKYYHLGNSGYFKFSFTCIKMSKDSSAKYYQDNKEKLQIKLLKDIKVFL